jgi:large subunit ribosomal protein L22
MHAVARTKYLRMSPKKVRQVANLIKGKPVLDALNILNFTPKAAAHQLAKTLKSAAANAIANEGTSKLKAEDLSVKKVFIDAAPTMKRIRFQSMGRIFRIRKRMCHITIEVEGEPEPETTTRVRKTRGRKTKAAADKAEKPKKTRKTTKKATGKKTKGKETVDESKTGAPKKGASAKNKKSKKESTSGTSAEKKATKKARAKADDDSAGDVKVEQNEPGISEEDKKE